jgi:Holliday junction resolvase RusA-like endonuclease
MSPFDYLNAINDSKVDIMIDDIAEKGYNAFMVNRGLSYFQDTVIFANEMNRYHHLDSRLSFDFYINIIRKRKRFSKWFKSSESDSLNVVKEYYGYSNEKAKQVLSLLTDLQLIELKQRMSKGGKR